MDLSNEPDESLLSVSLALFKEYSVSDRFSLI